MNLGERNRPSVRATVPLAMALCFVPGALPGAPLHVNSRSLILSYDMQAATDVASARLWFSRDDGQSWHEAAQDQPCQQLKFEAQNDGKYFFYIVLENKGGASAPPPQPGTEPHLTAIVDTIPPTLQLHGANSAPSELGSALVRIRASALDENLGSAATRVFYRADATSGWQDGGNAALSDGLILWNAPPDIDAVVDLRVTVTDLSGNRADDEILDVAIPSAGRLQPPRGTAAAAQPDPGDSQSDPLAVPPIEPPLVEPVPPVTLDEQPEAAPPMAAGPLAESRADLARLRDQAQRFLAQGRLSLAAARIEDALRIAPEDPDLLVDWGSVAFRNRQYNQADQSFRRALQNTPNHIGAIEGLALVAATENRYPEARSHLQHLLRLEPESAQHWLHLGDIEHKLGNTAKAYDAWERVLQFSAADGAVVQGAQDRLKIFRREPVMAK